MEEDNNIMWENHFFDMIILFPYAAVTNLPLPFCTVLKAVVQCGLPSKKLDQERTVYVDMVDALD